MDKLDVVIAEQIRRVAGAGQGKRFPVMSGVVMSVEDDGTCTVQLTADADETPTDGILLNVVSENTLGISLSPSVNADCIVCEVDGPGQLKQLLWASKYDKIVVSVAGNAVLTMDGSVLQMNDGSLGGMVILQKAVDNLNALKDYIFNVLQPAIAETIAAVGVGSAADGPTAVSGTWTPAIEGQTITFENMENANIKQG